MIPSVNIPSPASGRAFNRGLKAPLQSDARRSLVVSRVAADRPPTAEPPKEDRKKISMISLGCPKNVVDGEVLLGDLNRSGFDIIEDHESADAIVVNTCAFVEEAKTESIEAILEAAQMKDGGAKKLIITGCLAQRYSKDLAEEFPEVDLVMGFEKYGDLPNTLRTQLGMPALGADFDVKKASSTKVHVGDATVPFRSETVRHRLTPKHTAYLRVAEGCNHACTFCAIPSFRGKFRSKAWNQVVEEAKVLAASGVRELNLIAEDTNQYGQDRRDGKNLAVLMRELSAIEGIEWIRILYAYPSYFTEDLVEEIANNPKVCKYIDMPLQHISSYVLLGMNRPPQAHTMNLLKRLRDGIPDLALRTTFISGFPGEREEDHKELVDFVREFRFERMGCFAYSEEDGTPAATMQEQVDPDVRQARRDELVSIQQEISSRYARSRLGKEVMVLVDGYNEDGELVGRTQHEAPDVDPVVFMAAPLDPKVRPAQPGEFRRCKIIGASICDVEAEPID